MKRRSPAGPALIASVLLHVGVLSLMLWAGLAKKMPEPTPLALELWTSAPPPPPAAEPVTTAKPAIQHPVKLAPATPAPAHAAVEAPKAEVNLGHHHRPVVAKHEASTPTPHKPAVLPLHKEAPKPVAKPEPKPVKPAPKVAAAHAEPAPAKTAKASPKDVAKPVAKPQANKPDSAAAKNKSPADSKSHLHAPANVAQGKGTRQAKAYNPEADDLLSDLNSTNTTRKGNARYDQAGGRNGVAGGSANGSSAARDGWVSRVQAKVRPQVELPADLKGNPKAVLLVRLLPSLEVQSVRVLQSSGNDAYDEAVQRAVREAHTFPSLPSGASFGDYRQIKLEFRPHS